MEYFETGKILGIEQRSLPANTYNIMRTLFHQCTQPCLFVPIRSMQYQAIVDEKEVAFVYGHRRSHIEFSWRHFQPQLSKSLNDPVFYEFVYYDKQALETMRRIQGELHKFAHQLYERTHEAAPNDRSNTKKVTTFKPT
jgi:hypothetical protein